MARSRSIKPGFFKNDTLAEIEPLGRLLFAGLWTIADREGRLEDRPKRIKAELLPYDDCDVEQLLQELHNYGFILRYEVEGERYIQISKFRKHQNPHKNEPPSDIPAPVNHSVNHSDTSTVQAPEHSDINPEDYYNKIKDYYNKIKDYSDIQDYTSDFEAFWTEYPRKKEKRRAFNAWLKLQKLPAKIRPRTEDLIAAARHYAEYCKKNVRDPTFIKYPATFLSVRDRPWEEYVSSVPAETEEDAERKKRREKYKDVYLS